ncbi:MAG: SIS domain-containing protein [Nitrospira sp.]|nr:SIS domain-containing protein [Nitrospira sp.]
MGTVVRYFEDLAGVFGTVEVTRGDGRSVGLSHGIEQAITIITDRTASGRKIIFIGNGGSAAIASHQAVDFLKNGGMRAMAFNDSALLTCVGNDYGYPHVFETPIAMLADPGDVLIAISSSGRSENILRGSQMALSKGCDLMTMSGFTPDNSLRSMGQLNFYAPSSSYGYVEITHLALCHCIVDLIIARRA